MYLRIATALASFIVGTTSLCGSAQATPGKYLWGNNYFPVTTAEICSDPDGTGEHCEMTGPSVLTVEAADVGRQLFCGRPSVLQCEGINGEGKSAIYPPPVRDALANGNPPFFSHEYITWGCDDVEQEARSRLYWIEKWKAEVQRGQIMRKQISALRARCGAACN